MNTRRSPATASALLALAFAASVSGACSGTPGDAGEPDGVVPGEVDDAQMLAAAQARALGVDSPINVAWNDAVGAGALDPSELMARFENEARRVEELTAQCMAEQGFEYLPRAPSQRGRTNPIFDPDLDFRPWDRDWVAIHGFGNDLRLPLFGAGEAPDALDPNAAVRAHMSEAEEEAWWLALHGDPATVQRHEDGSLDDHSPWAEMGCVAWAWAWQTTA